MVWGSGFRVGLGFGVKGFVVLWWRLLQQLLSSVVGFGFAV